MVETITKALLHSTWVLRPGSESVPIQGPVCGSVSRLVALFRIQVVDQEIVED